MSNLQADHDLLLGDRVAVLAADLHGLGALMATDEPAAIDLLQATRRMIEERLASHAGTLVDRAEQGVLVRFATADAALDFALELQAAAATTRELADSGLQLRVGINMGRGLEGEPGADGLSTGIACRIRDWALPGGICVSEEVRKELGDGSAAKMFSIGAPPLKNVAASIELHSVAMPYELPSPPGRSLPTIGAGERRVVTQGISVVVLPIAGGSGEAIDRSIVDGIGADLIMDLARFRELRVIARHATYLFRQDKVTPLTPSMLPSEARYGVRGSLTRREGNLCLRLELFEPGAGGCLWTNETSLAEGDELDAASQACTMSVSRMAKAIQARERELSRAAYPFELQAHVLALRAELLGERLTPRSNAHAYRLFEQSAELDPRFPRAYVGMSRCYHLAWKHRWHEASEACLDRAMDLALFAVRLDTMDPRAHAELGFASLHQRQHRAALACYERGLMLNPNDADIVAEMAHALVFVDQCERAVPMLEQAILLNPQPPDWYFWALGNALFGRGDYGRAINELCHMRRIDQAHGLLAACHALLGNQAAAADHAAGVLRADPTFRIDLWTRVWPYQREGTRDRFVEALRLAGL